jgi:hypothetical protein
MPIKEEEEEEEDKLQQDVLHYTPTDTFILEIVTHLYSEGSRGPRRIPSKHPGPVTQ